MLLVDAHQTLKICYTALTLMPQRNTKQVGIVYFNIFTLIAAAAKRKPPNGRK